MNVVTLIGNVATDVELREPDGDTQVASFVLAVDRAGAGDKADFVRIAAWGKQAEACSRFLGKGRRVAVEGRLRSRSWQDADGKRRSAIEVRANSVQFLSPRDDGESRDTAFQAAAAT